METIQILKTDAEKLSTLANESKRLRSLLKASSESEGKKISEQLDLNDFLLGALVRNRINIETKGNSMIPIISKLEAKISYLNHKIENTTDQEQLDELRSELDFNKKLMEVLCGVCGSNYEVL